VQLLQVTPTPATTAPTDSKVIGARVTIVVDNLEASCKFWMSPKLMGDKKDPTAN